MPTLYAMFDEASHALGAIGALLNKGVRTADISIISKDSPVRSGDGPRGDHANPFPEHSENGRNRKDEAIGIAVAKQQSGDTCVDAVKGAGIGLGVGLTAALVSIAIPGFGLVAGGGALATAIAGAASATAAGAVAGGAISYFRDSGVPEQSLDDLMSAYERGWAIVAVEIPDGTLDPAIAHQTLIDFKAKNVNTFNAMATVSNA